MTDTTTTSKTRTITLTARPPVKIREDEWPILASAQGDSYRGHDYGRYQQSLSQDECDTYRLMVRQHADGRTLIYGVLDAAIVEWHAPAAGESHRGGVMIEPPSEDFAARGAWIWAGSIGDGPERDYRIWPGVVAAIQQVGEECGLPDSVIRECIADLPAQEL